MGSIASSGTASVSLRWPAVAAERQREEKLFAVVPHHVGNGADLPPKGDAVWQFVFRRYREGSDAAAGGRRLQ